MVRTTGALHYLPVPAGPDILMQALADMPSCAASGLH